MMSPLTEPEIEAARLETLGRHVAADARGAVELAIGGGAGERRCPRRRSSAFSSLGVSFVVTLPLTVSVRSDPCTPVTLIEPETEVHVH